MQVALGLKRSPQSSSFFRSYKKRALKHRYGFMNSTTQAKRTTRFSGVFRVILSPKPSNKVIWPVPDITHQNLDDFIALGKPTEYPFHECRQIGELYFFLLEKTDSLRKEIKLNGEFVHGGFLYTISQWNKLKRIPLIEISSENKKRYEALPLIKDTAEEWLESNSIKGIGAYTLGIRGSLSQGLSTTGSDVDLTFSHTGIAKEDAVDEMMSTLKSHLAKTLQLAFDVEIKRLY